MSTNLRLYPSSIEEWEGEDLLAESLATTTEMADDAAARQMLESVRLELPAVLGHDEIVTMARARRPPFALELAAPEELYE